MTTLRLAGKYEAIARELGREDEVTPTEAVRRLLRLEAERRWKDKVGNVVFMNGRRESST